MKARILKCVLSCLLVFGMAAGCIVGVSADREMAYNIYSNPDLTPEERNAEWAKLEKIYRPHIDFDNLPFYGRGAGWQRQLHIYLYPFYYLDYCMAQAMALEFFSLHLQDQKYAWEKYLEFVKLGGTKTFVGLIEALNLKTPLTEGTLKDVVAELDAWLETHSV